MKTCMLTTFDNPYNPLVQYDAWYNYDINRSIRFNCQDCCSLLARFAHTSDALTDEENAQEIERAIDEIIKYDFTNAYKKVWKEEQNNLSE